MPAAFSPRTLREWLYLTHTSQRTLAKDVGCHQTMISALARGERAARGDLAVRIRDRTGVPLDVLVVRIEPKRPSPRQRQRRKTPGAKKR
jgi:hypothetical protein